MRNLQLTILTKKDLEKRYEQQLKDTPMARLTAKAIADGYSIAIMQYPGLNHDYAMEWLRYVRKAVAARFKGQSYKIGVFTDLSQVNKDKLYFAFKTKEESFRIAHSFSGCDSEGFIYN